MANFNKVFLMGNLTRDIEMRFTSGNQAVANMGLAVNRRYRTKDGENREETTFVDCEAWGRTAEVMNEYLTKGKPVFIEGRLKLDQWEDKEGNKKSKLRVVVENFQFIDSRGGDGNSGGGKGDGGGHAYSSSGSSSGGGGGGSGAGSGGSHEPISEDDIPF